MAQSSPPEGILPLALAGEPVLRTPARPLGAGELGTPELRALCERMHRTMRAAPGVGLAAPQVALGLALAVIEDRPEYQDRLPPARLELTGRRPVPFHALCNPRLEPVEGAGEFEFWEGCLSVPGYIGLVRRHLAVRVDAFDPEGQPVRIEARGWYARILQHEIDHLEGRLYLDRLTPRTLCEQAAWQAHWAEAPVEDAKRALGA